MTIQEYAAVAIEKSAEDLIRAAFGLPEDKREWQPLDKGRTALNQLVECAFINMMSAQLIEAVAWSDSLMAQRPHYCQALDTVAKAIEGLNASTAHLAAAVRGAADTSLGTEIVMPWSTETLAQVFLMPLWNMTYHEGQITYIKTMLV